MELTLEEQEAAGSGLNHTSTSIENEVKNLEKDQEDKQSTKLATTTTTNIKSYTNDPTTETSDQNMISLKRKLRDEAMKLPDMNIVVSGLAGRFPKSNSVNEFEENLFQGVDMVNDNDESRFTTGLWGLPPRAGRLKELNRFDHEFFGYSIEEAHFVDYQMRILYEVVYESILDAGLNPASLRGSNTGVFFGLHCNEFENAMADDPRFKTSSGYFAQFATRIANYFDFRGLTMTFDAACASGFVGLHNAIQAIDQGLIEQAIVCSSNIPIHPTGSFIFLQMQMLSPTGYSRFLDSRADGYVKSESVVSVLLQRKLLARRNYASIMASMTSVDGFKKEGITFPSDKSQERLMQATKQLVGLSVNHVEYLEAHGTGTPAGDPQEAKAISSVYYPSKEYIQEQGLREELNERKVGPLLVGSVKTNMGHSEAASGLCALTKIAMMLENEIIYKSLHFESPNKNVEALMSGKLKFTVERQKLSSGVVPLSCYGFGGSNVHVILRANQLDQIDQLYHGDEQQFKRLGKYRLITMFGRGLQQLNYFFDQIQDTKSRSTKNCLTEDFLTLIDSLNSGGKIDRLMGHRGFLILDENQQEVCRSISKFKVEPITRERGSDKRIHPQDQKEVGCNIILTGIGCQWPQMAAGLRNLPQFWQTIERLNEIIIENTSNSLNLINLLTIEEQTTMTEKFLSIVAYQIGLLNIIKTQLRVNNIKSLIGFSLGEISCAYAAGLFDEREAILVAYQLGSTIDKLQHSLDGTMVVIGLSEEEALSQIVNYESIKVSCVNGPQSVTLSGRRVEMNALCSSFDNSIFQKEVEGSFALHNESIMGPEVREALKSSLLNELSKLSYKRDRSIWLSTVNTENRKLLDEANADYFAECLCRKVDFVGALEKLEDGSICLEVGPHGLFESHLRHFKSRSGEEKFRYAKLMKRDLILDEQELFFMKSVGYLYSLGATFDLTNFYHPFGWNYPVRRQTPSLSSLIRWEHCQDFFVPRYPIQFSKSSAKCEIPVDILQERDKYMVGHCVEGRYLFPATGYLFMIWRVLSFTKRKIYDACFQSIENELVPIEFHNVRLLRAVILGNRSVQMYIHYEEATGRFEVKEGGSVVVEGWARSPEENPDGLLHDNVRERIQKEQLEFTMNSDDIYKQFRVSGYDYGETFRNITLSSSDGRHSKVKFNGYFVALTDSILQTIFLAVSQYAPSGGLFLPTKFEYVRFNPSIILEKLRKLNLPIDLSDSSLNTNARREIMSKIMQREGGDLNQAEVKEENAQQKADEGEEKEKKPELPKEECIFETFCDPITGIIVSDGIEMRGIKATPAPRRQENNELLLESQQFIKDIEDPVEDEKLTRFNQLKRPYIEACDLAADLIAKQICTGQPLEPEVTIKTKLNDYKRKHLNSLYIPLKDRELDVVGDDDSNRNVDMKANKSMTLLSVLDQLQETVSQAEVKKVVQKNRNFLIKDLIQGAFESERLMRPILETIVENACQKKLRLKYLEINADDGILKDHFHNLMRVIEPQLTLDYSLTHPNIEHLQEKNIIQSTSSNNQMKTYTLRNLSTLFTENQLNELDLIVYKDISCYNLPKQVIEKNGLEPVMKSLSNNVKSGGFILVLLRKQLTKAERILLALTEPKLVGLSGLDAREVADGLGLKHIEYINTILSKRGQQMLDEAERNNLQLVASKSDLSGCSVLLFRSTGAPTSADSLKQQALQNEVVKPLILQVKHQSIEEIQAWLERLKKEFKVEEEETSDDISNNVDGIVKKETSTRDVWLCSVATRNSTTSGLVGMVKALRKELGRARIRCFLDNYTFRKKADLEVTIEDIEKSVNFQKALSRNMLWNVVDAGNNFGSFRHFTINDYLSPEHCSCESQGAVSYNTTMEELDSKVEGAFVNNAVRGDLSSFTWYEAPLRYRSEGSASGGLVKVAYSALNFRDIMLASGRLPLDAIPIKMATSDCLLGLEFSGLDEKSGKRVMGMVPGRGIATHILCDPKSSFKLNVPDSMSLEEAATIPVVYATVILAMIERGRIREGESILIHAGSGGVGQAAIRIAAHYKMKIFTTVGSDEKRDFLIREFGYHLTDDDIFSSRDCNFEEGIMRATRGRGVDLILNSLADDKLAASIRCLADGGRFLEIGKYDMSIDSQLELLKLDTNKTFHGILLDKLFEAADYESPEFEKQMRSVLGTLQRGLIEGFVQPIKYTIFKRDRIEEAVRYMANGRHIGKVLIEIDSRLNDGKVSGGSLVGVPGLKCVPRFQLSTRKTYIVTGGLGGFGMELVKWLCSQGARNLIITSRRGIQSGYQATTLARLRKNSKVNWRIVTYDTTVEEGVEQLLTDAIELSPDKSLGGSFHLAMVLKDSLLEKMTPEMFEMVLRPKVNTLEYLDKEIEKRHLELDYFVAFSSVTSGKGNAGQANYAYANSCIEQICQMRHERGQHGLAIQWGAVGDVGVVYETLGGNEASIGGTIPQRIHSCLATLPRLLCSELSVCLSLVTVGTSTEVDGERMDLVSAIMHVLGIKDSSKVSEQANLGELGLDSLMAVEIRQYIEREYDMTLNIQEIRSLTIAKIRQISESGPGRKGAAAVTEAKEETFSGN